MLYGSYSIPLTQNEVVKETMLRSLNVANKLQRSYAIGTYGLAVAAKAYSIQALEAPATDKLVILLGNFHLEMAYFGALGTYIHESGAEFIFTESGILAVGSLIGFIKGKFYNRCIRIHPTSPVQWKDVCNRNFSVHVSARNQ